MDIFSGMYFFTEEHEWIRVENNIAFVGLTTLAKRELGQIFDIEIHKLGKDLIENQVFGRITTNRYEISFISTQQNKGLSTIFQQVPDLIKKFMENKESAKV